MEKIIFVIIILFTLFSCKESEIDIIKKHDRILTDSNNLSWEYIDSLTNVYPEISYFIGIKAYFMSLGGKKVEAYSYLKKETIKEKSLANNTFILLAYASMTDSIEELKLSKEEYLLKSVERDKLSLNKWSYLELSYLYESINKEKALLYVNKALLSDTLFYDAIVQKAYLKDEVKNCAEIIHILKKVKNSFIDYYYLGTAHFFCKNYEDAVIYLEKAYIEDSNNCFCILYLAWSNYYCYNNIRASYLFRMLAKKSNDQFFYNEIITFYLLIDEDKNAKHYLDESLEYNERSFYHDGFDIILFTPASSEKLDEKLNQYYKKYSKKEIDWIESLTKEIYQDYSFLFNDN